MLYLYFSLFSNSSFQNPCLFFPLYRNAKMHSLRIIWESKPLSGPCSVKSVRPAIPSSVPTKQCLQL